MPAPSSSEMTGALMEFHQRNQGLIKPVGPPPPFEITSVVQQPQPVVWPSRRKIEDDPTEQQGALVAYEKNFEFSNFGISGDQSGFPLWLTWYFHCHDQGTIAEDSYIRMYPGSYWRSFNPPGLSGHIAFGFNGSSWTPPPPDQLGPLIYLTILPLGVPNNVYEAHAYFAFYIEQVGNPQQFSDHIYAVGVNPNSYALHFYQADNGLGIDLLFHSLIIPK